MVTLTKTLELNRGASFLRSIVSSGDNLTDRSGGLMDGSLETIHFTLAVLTSAIAVIAWRVRGLRGASELTGLMVCLTFWLIASALVLVAPDLPTKIVWQKLTYFGAGVVPPLWLIFAARVTLDPKWLTPGLTALLFVVPLITLTLLFSTNLVLQDFRVDPDLARGVTSSVGPWWGAHLLYSYGTLIAGTLLLARAWTQHRGVYRRQLGLWIISVTIPFGLNILRQTAWLPALNFDPSPAALALCSLLILNGLLRHRLLALEPIALEGAVDNLRDGFIVLDDEHRVVRANPAAHTEFSVNLRNAPGEDAMRILKAWPLLQPALTVYRDQTMTVAADGLERDLEYRVSPVRDWRGRITASVVIVRDVTEVRRYQRRIAEWAFRDALTGLANRRSLFDEGTAMLEVARDTGQPCAVIYIDLDGFKAINDRLGHNVGDHILARVAGRLLDLNRVDALVTRNGGDEFVIVVSTDRDSAAALIKRLQTAITTGILVDGKELHVGCSIGLAMFPEDGDHLEALLRSADGAMYTVKRVKPRSR